MNTVKTLTLIETTLGRRGRGTENSPTRVITQYWTQEGKLVAEIDPAAICFTPEQMADMQQVLLKICKSQKQAGYIWHQMMISAGAKTP